VVVGLWAWSGRDNDHFGCEVFLVALCVISQVAWLADFGSENRTMSWGICHLKHVKYLHMSGSILLRVVQCDSKVKSPDGND